MQTFLPYADFKRSAASLDRQRLGKQRVEAYQILRTLLGVTTGGWLYHPAVKMWRGSEATLVEYTEAVCDEWINRGYKDTVKGKVQALAELAGDALGQWAPQWLGNEDLHRSHRANLVAKDKGYYAPQFGELPWEEYVWPGGRGEKEKEQ